MVDVAPRLVLASSSPRRRDLLRSEGFEFLVAEPNVDESALEGEPPERTAARLALTKARTVAERVHPASCVLAADTIVVVDDDVLGKPRDAEEAIQMLLRLADRTHRVITGYVAMLDGSPAESGVEVSRVRMRALSGAEARAYAATGEPLDKAGAYAVQGVGGRFVAHIDGSRSNVVGLPLEAVVPALRRLGVDPT